MSDSKKAQNLARIRDNQRRSRARRKEYLQELETKLRNCDQMGIEASAEIQSAARKVLDENRKLRALLHERGVSDADIVMAMGTTSDRPYDHVSAASSLSVMLERRITCNNTSSCTNSPVSANSTIPRPSPHASAVSPLSIPVPRSTALSSSDSPSPHSIVSSTDTPPAFHGSPFYSSPMTPGPDIKTEDVPPYNPYNQSFSSSWTYQSGVHYIPDPTSFYSTSSPVDATNITRTMRTDFSLELQNGLGCTLASHEYYVNNPVFNPMDKYANPQSV